MADENALIVIFSLIITCALVGAMVYTETTHAWQKDAIAHGYAQYCPIDGEFAWLGECKE